MLITQWCTLIEGAWKKPCHASQTTKASEGGGVKLVQTDFGIGNVFCCKPIFGDGETGADCQVSRLLYEALP